MPGLAKGTRVEVAPFRNGRPYHEYYAYDGFTGTVLGPTQSGSRLWVLIDGKDAHRSGKKGLPPEVLMPLKPA